jgi:hypothetical protein
MATLVLVMSEQCGACQQFKARLLPTIQRDLENDHRFKFVILEFPTMRVNPPKNNEYHPDLRNFIKWFPTFIMFPSNLWENSRSKLTGVIKHGDEENPKIDYSRNSLFSWIDETLKKPGFSSNNILVVDNGKPLGSMSKHTVDGKHYVPTLGTYTKFRNAKRIEHD